MAVFIDYVLAPSGKTLLTAPQVVDKMNEAMGDSSDSPTLANAPLVLQQSLIFPYVAGLNFVRAVWTAKGRDAAFAEMLDHPPSSTYEIMNPAIYLTHAPVPLLKMPDIHSLIDAEYRPYDIGVMGEFDVQLMAELVRWASGGKCPGSRVAWGNLLHRAIQRRHQRERKRLDWVAGASLFVAMGYAGGRACVCESVRGGDSTEI